MDVYSLFTLLGGLAFFIFGMSVMSARLEKLAGGSLEKTLRKTASGPLKGLALGAGITIAIQSSSALTVMLVGLVNSGIMELRQSVGVIMGSNIGTTFTAWILSLSGISRDSFAGRIFSPDTFAPLAAFAGIILTMASKRSRNKDIGNLLVSFAVLMFGMRLMKEAFTPLDTSEVYHSVTEFFTNPAAAILAGILLSAAVHSSVASVAVLQCLAAAGGITYGLAVPVITGMNIGTCITAFVSSRSGNRNARRAALVHIYFNAIGTAVCLVLFYIINAVLKTGITERETGMFGIAVVHTLFNVVFSPKLS